MAKELAVAIPTNKAESSKWWPAVFGELLRTANDPGYEITSLITAGGALTDTNRNKCVKSFLEKTDAEYLVFIDNDTIPPPRAFAHLIELNVDVANAIYYLRGEPYNPVAYRLMPNHKYLPLKEFRPGEIVDVDSVGMGCTVIKRHVFERIIEEYVCFMRTRIGSGFAIHKDDVQYVDSLPMDVHEVAPGVLRATDGVRGYMIDPVEGPIPGDEVERFPFFVLEWGRTEDHYFNEMTRRLGFETKVDTWLECEHVGEIAYDGSNFRELLADLQNYIALKGEMGYEGRRDRVEWGRGPLAGTRDNEARESARVERAV